MNCWRPGFQLTREWR